MNQPIRVALIHDWLTGMRGGEYVLEAIAEIFPRSDLFTLIYVPGRIAPAITALKRHTSWLQKIPKIESRYRYFLPLMPKAIESFDLTGFDLIISSSHCVAKGIRKPKDAFHVSYVFAPMRYMWDRFDEYFGPPKSSAPVRALAHRLRPFLQNWDRQASSTKNVDELMSISRYIATQVKNAYGRDSEIIYPFVNLDRFQLPRQAGRNYLLVSAFAPYKRVELAIEAFNRLKLPLLVVGSGQDEKRLKKLAGPTIEILGSLSNSAISDLYRKCKAFIFPGEEDFGITPLEAMASGAPVIAYGSGGVLETVTEKTGIFFRPQTVEALMEAVLKIENGEIKLSEADCRARAREFSKEKFQTEFITQIKKAWLKSGRDLKPLEEKIEAGWAFKGDHDTHRINLGTQPKENPHGRN